MEQGRSWGGDWLHLCARCIGNWNCYNTKVTRVLSPPKTCKLHPLAVIGIVHIFFILTPLVRGIEVEFGALRRDKSPKEAVALGYSNLLAENPGEQDPMARPTAIFRVEDYICGRHFNFLGSLSTIDPPRFPQRAGSRGQRGETFRKTVDMDPKLEHFVLVGGLVAIFYFCIYWECHHPN